MMLISLQLKQTSGSFEVFFNPLTTPISGIEALYFEAFPLVYLIHECSSLGHGLWSDSTL